MRVDFNTRIINRGITRTPQSLQTPNDKLGKMLLQGDSRPNDNVTEIVKNKELMSKMANFFKKFV